MLVSILCDHFHIGSAQNWYTCRKYSRVLSCEYVPYQLDDSFYNELRLLASLLALLRVYSPQASMLPMLSLEETLLSLVVQVL